MYFLLLFYFILQSFSIFLSFTAIKFEARFTSKKSPTATGLNGVNLKEALAGAGLLQVAVDKTVIPLKSKLSITLWDGKKVTAHAVDSGPKGNNINILVNTTAEANTYGVKSVDVTILKSVDENLGKASIIEVYKDINSLKYVSTMIIIYLLKIQKQQQEVK